MPRHVVERRLPVAVRRPGTIARLERVNRFGFTPALAIADARIAQPGWVAMRTGDLARLDRATALLLGRMPPCDVTDDGLHLTLIRTAEGPMNCRHDTPGGPTIPRSTVAYRDARQDRHFDVTLAAGPVRGVRGQGQGVVRGAAVTITLAARRSRARRAGQYMGGDRSTSGRRSRARRADAGRSGSRCRGATWR